MRPVVDPEGVEVSHFIQACKPVGKNVLEIGCGHGTFTYQYMKLPKLVVGIDPVVSELKLAIENQPKARSNEIFICSKGEALPFPSRFFDIVFFASSL